MPVLVPGHGVIVTAAPGTGSTTLLAVVGAWPGATPVPCADVVVDGVTRVDAKHATVAQLTEAGLLAPDTVPTIVTSTRNPFDFWAAEWERTRTRWVAELRDPVSWVHRQPGMVGRIVDAVEMDFDVWVLHALGPDLEAGRTRHLNDGHVAEADAVVRMEDLADDLAAVLAGAGVDAPVGPVPHLNPTPGRRPYWQLYSPEARAAVETVFAPDLERFGYRF